MNESTESPKPLNFQQLKDCIKRPRKEKKTVRAYRTVIEAWRAK